MRKRKHMEEIMDTVLHKTRDQKEMKTRKAIGGGKGRVNTEWKRREKMEEERSITRGEREKGRIKQTEGRRNTCERNETVWTTQALTEKQTPNSVYLKTTLSMLSPFRIHSFLPLFLSANVCRS